MDILFQNTIEFYLYIIHFKSNMHMNMDYLVLLHQH